MSFGGPFRSIDELPVRDGALPVVSVRRHSKADDLGLRSGDLIVNLNGRSVAHYDKASLYRALSERRMIALEVIRGEERLRFTIR